jgi:hypothetical protein
MKNKRSGTRAFGFTLIVAAFLLLSSCPEPIGKATAVQVRDVIAPVIVISSPAEGSLCANVVEIAGTVTDAATESGNDGKAASMSYEVSGSTVAGEIQFSPNGSFAFQISTVTLGTNFTLSITAVDWNGNTAKVLLPLSKQSGSGIPSLAVSPGNQQATLTWDPVPHTASYTLYYTTNGALPSEQVGVKVLNATSPCVLSGLPDGNMHVFQLKTVPETGWPESISDYIKAIPLSPQTLAPKVTGGIRQIRVEWDPVPATEEYEVWRSTAQNGTYSNLSGPIRSASYLDTGVANSQWYWYKVRPTLSGSADSCANGAQTDPFCFNNPRVVATCSSIDANDVVISGSNAYVADVTWGLHVVDISDPASPVLRGTCQTSGGRVVVIGTYAYLMVPGYGMKVIDISNPNSPSITGNCITTYAVGIAVSGSYAYIADNTAGLQVINVSAPATPVIVGTCSTGITRADGVAVSGNYAYVANGSSGSVHVVNVVTPSAPTVSNTYAQPGAKAVAVSGSYVYVACGTNGLKVYSISGATLVYVGTCAGNADWVTISGSFAYVTDHFAGLRVIDISTPATPVLRTTCTTSYASGVAASGSYAYVADDYAGLRVVELSIPSAAPAIVGSGGGATTSVKVAVSGSYAYVADSYQGLRVIDISNPTLPSLKGTCTGIRALEAAVSGSYAYIADPDTGFSVVDISDPFNPTKIGYLSTVMAKGVAVLGSYAYAAAGTTGLQVIDISDPTNPILISTCATTNAQGVAVSGSYVYVADGNYYMRVIDISNPTLPTLKGTYTTTDFYVRGVAVSGSYAYVSYDSYGLHVIDITNPSSPAWVATVNTAGYAWTAVPSGSYVYVADGSMGLQVIDISTPSSPYLRGTRDTTNAQGIAVSGAYAYVADAASGLQVIKLSP